MWSGGKLPKSSKSCGQAEFPMPKETLLSLQFVDHLVLWVSDFLVLGGQIGDL
jgi:hypothetical protein